MYLPSSECAILQLMTGGSLVGEPYARLQQPLVRRNGELMPASWEEALNSAASGFRAAVARNGPTTFGLFSCSKATNEVNYLAQKFARQVIGCNNVDSCNRT
jgi:formate dehydrogenase major subunit